jgi:hypothetical protein
VEMEIAYLVGERGLVQQANRPTPRIVFPPNSTHACVYLSFGHHN